jgi:hypothetical protein
MRRSTTVSLISAHNVVLMTPLHFLGVCISNQKGWKMCNERLARRSAGKLGRLLRFNAEKQRWGVLLEDGAKKILVRARNLEAIGHASGAEPPPPKAEELDNRLVLSSLLTKAAATGDKALVVRWLDGGGNVDAVDGNG